MSDILPTDGFQEALRKAMLDERQKYETQRKLLRLSPIGSPDDTDPSYMPEDDPWSDENAWRDGSVRTGINRYRRNRP